MISSRRRVGRADEASRVCDVLIIRVKSVIGYVYWTLHSIMEHEIGPDELLSSAVVRAVSAAEDREPLALPPLAGVLDPDALDVIFAADGCGEPKTGGRLSFVYSDSRVTIENGEYLSIQPLLKSRRSPRRHMGCPER